MATTANSKLFEDIQSLDKKLYKLQYSSINSITEKAATNKYSKNDINNFLEDAQLKEKFEKIVYVNLINTIKSYDLVLKILLSGDDQMISDALRKCLFFFSDPKFTPEFYIDKVYPKISYTNRNKLSKVIAKNSNEARNEKFYTILNKVYNHQAAKAFLPYCSEEFIVGKLCLEIKLNNADLLIVQKRNPRFALKYFEELCNLSGNNSSIFYEDNLNEYYELILKLLPLFPKEILELSKKHKDTFKFPNVGKRSSKRIINKAKEFVIINSNEYNKNLKSTLLHRYLNPAEFCLFYQHLMPPNNEHFDLEYEPLRVHLDYYKTNDKKLELLVKCYANCYGKKLLSNLNNISPEILILLPPNERIRLAEQKIKNGGDKFLTRTDWMKFLPTDISIRRFKDEIYFASQPYKRIQIIKLMLESCGINHDYDALLEVLTYFNKRHRNEFECGDELYSIIDIYFDLNKLNEMHWKEILLIFDKMLKINKYHGFSDYRKFFVKPIENAIRNNLNLKFYLRYYIKWLEHTYDSNRFKIFDSNKQWNKLCLLEIGKLLPEMNYDEYKYETNANYFYTTITDWNETNPNDMLSIMDYQWAIDHFEKQIENNYDLPNFVCQLQYDKKAKEYFKSKILKKESFDIFYLGYFVTWNTELIKIVQPEILKYMFEMNRWKSYILPHLKRLFKIEGMEQAIKENCVKHFNDVNNDCRTKAIRIMVKMNWLSSEQFFKLAQDNNPAGKEIKLGTDREEKIVILRKTIVYCIKYFKTNPEALKLIKLYTQGDYLKYSIGTIYNICTKLPHYIIDDFLLSFVEKAVSIKKNIIRIKCLISKHEENLAYLKQLWHSENHPTIRSVVIKLMITECLYYCDNSHEFVWSCIQTLTSQDKALIDELHVPIKKIFKTNRGRYLEQCWPLVDKTTFKDSDARLKFLEAFKIHIELLNPKFIEHLLLDNLFKLNILNPKHFITLSISYILINAYEAEQRLHFILNIMRKAINENWNTLILDNENNFNYEIKNIISYFCTKLASEVILSKSEISMEILKLLENKLNEIVKDPEVILYDSYWTIKFSNLYLNSGKNFELFGNQLRFLIVETTNINEYILLTKFLNILKNFLNIFLEYNNPSEHKIKVIEGLLSKSNEKCALIAVNLVEDDDLRNTAFKQFYETLLTLNKSLYPNAINYKINRIS